MKNILVVDDDLAIGRMLTDYLSQYEFRIQAVENSRQLTNHLAGEVPDLLIVDMNLGDEDGIDIVRSVSERRSLPIIAISGERLDESTRVQALEIGAHDYIAKPFSLREMLARIRAALRIQSPRSSGGPAKIFTFNTLRLSTRNRRLHDASGHEIKLTSGEFNLLVGFLNHPHRVLSREQLLLETRVHDQEIFDRSLDVLVLRLRRKLARQGADHSYIRTERGVGYVFDCEVNVEVLRSRVQ